MGRESVPVHWVVIVLPPPARTTHANSVCVGPGRRWAFWGDHPGGVAATPPQRGTLFRDGARVGSRSLGSYCFTTPRRSGDRHPPPKAVGIQHLRWGGGKNHKFSKILSRRSARSSVSSYSNLISGTYF